MVGKRDETEAGERLNRDIAIWIGALEDQTDRMTEWETSFLENISDQFSNGSLSEKQVETLKKLYDKYY